MAKETRRVHVHVSSNVGTSMKKGSAQAKGLSGSLKGVQAAAMSATGGIRAMTAALISSGVGAFVVAIGALVGGVVTATRKSMEFAAEMSNLKAVLGKGGTNEAMAQLADDAKRLGASTAFTAKQVAELQVEFAKLGFTTDEILNVTEATLNLAAAAGTDLATAATVAGSTLRAFGLGSQETARVVDVMAMSFSTSSLDLEKFKESMKLVAPIAKSVKVPIEEASAALAVLANNGVSGSMAGTQLKRIMSDLAQKTGKDFATSMEIVRERLANATSDAERLAIAKEMVGDRAKGALLILAEQKDVLEELTTAYENAEGAAEDMAEVKLDNLQGDITKMKSAWEGFLLQIEDGNGLFTKIARNWTQGMTTIINFFNDLVAENRSGMEFLGEVWGGAGIMLKETFKQAADEIRLLFAQLKLAAADVPVIGAGIDKATQEASIKSLKASIAEHKMWTEMGYDRIRLAYAKHQQNLADIKSGKAREMRETDAKEQAAANEDFIEGEVDADEKAREKILENRKKFLAKLKKMEEDQDDVTEKDKIRRKMERHLAELDTLAYTETQKEEIAARIREYYRQEEEKAEAKAREKKEKEDARAAEKEAREAKKIADEKIAYEQELQRNRQQLMYSSLDTVSRMAGEESKISKAAMAIKLAMQLRELSDTMKIEMQKMAVKRLSAAQGISIDAAKAQMDASAGLVATLKAGMPQALPLVAMYAVQAASMLAAFSKSKKSLESEIGISGGSTPTLSASAPQAPSFNVLGATTAGENMIANTVAGTMDQPVRAYVLEGDVTTAQSAQRNTQDLASVG